MKLISNSAIVTGAGQGIGLGIAARLMRDGANVLLFGRTREKVEAVAGELNRVMEGRARAVAFAGDVVRAEDVAKVVSFLCSDLASWITGDTLAVDGGNHIRGLHSYADTLGLTRPVEG